MLPGPLVQFQASLAVLPTSLVKFRTSKSWKMRGVEFSQVAWLRSEVHISYYFQVLNTDSEVQNNASEVRNAAIEVKCTLAASLTSKLMFQYSRPRTFHIF